MPRGHVWWGDTGTKKSDNGFTSIGSWEEVEKLYREVFERLKSADRHRSATLRRNHGTPSVEDEHSWEFHPDFT